MKEKDLSKSSVLEKCFYGLGNLGANLCWTFMAMYVTMYYTNSVGLSAAVSGTIMLISRLLDGASDVAGAVLMERMNFKLGKIRPWFMIAAPLLAISLYLDFHVPMTYTAQGKAIYVFITYAFTAAIAFTIYNLAYSSILPLISLDDNDRNITSVTGNIILLAGLMAMSYVTPILLTMWGGTEAPAAWGSLSTVYAIICGILVFLMGVVFREKERPNEEPGETLRSSEKKEHFGQNIKMILTSKYTWILFGMFVGYYLFNGMAGIRVYYFMNVLGDFNLYGTAGLLGTLGTMVALFIVPSLFKKFGREKASIAGLILYIIANFVLFAFSGSPQVAIAATVIMNIALAPMTAALFIYLAELIDYFYQKSHEKVEVIVSMTSSVGTKIGTGVGSALVGWGLAFYGYDAKAAAQPVGVQKGIVIITTIVPIILVAIVIVLLKFWKIGQESTEKKSETV